MAPFDRSYTTFCWPAIVNIGVNIVKNLVPFLSHLTLNNIMILKSELEVTQGHSNRYHSNAWVRFPIRLP